MTDETLKILNNGGINWTWYMWLAVHPDGEVTVKRYDRYHDVRDTHPKSDGSIDRLTEEDGRILTEVKWRDADGVHTSKVRNPKCIFDYGG